MPLTWGRIVGYNASRMVFEFTMMDDRAHVVGCEISSVRWISLPAPEAKARCPLKGKLNFCTCGMGSSALRLMFSTKCRRRAGRSASSTTRFGNASRAKVVFPMTLPTPHGQLSALAEIGPLD